jgi:hypothetical protein
MTRGRGYIRTLDIAHPPLSSAVVEKILDEEIAQARSSHAYRVVKVIHGSGTVLKPGKLKEAVKMWAYRNRSRIRCVIAGEDYHLLDASTQQLRKELGAIADTDLGVANTGITLIWIR